MEMTNYKLILGSNSPRRKELLSGIDIEYEIVALPDIEESYPEPFRKRKCRNFLPEKSVGIRRNVLG